MRRSIIESLMPSEEVSGEVLDNNGAVVAEAPQQEEDKKEETEIIVLKNAIPVMIRRNPQPDLSEKLAMIFLCKTMEDKLIVIYSNYLTESAIENSAVCEFKILEKNLYITSNMATSVLLDTLDNYVVDMQFSISSPKLNGDITGFMLDAVKIDKDGKTNKAIFNVSVDLFAALSFFDTSVMNPVETASYGYEDLAISDCYSPKETTTATIVSDVKLLTLLPTKNKYNITVILEITDSENNTYTLIIPYGINTRFARSKFKGNSVKDTERIVNEHMMSADEFISSYDFNCHIKNIDKELYVVKGMNKDRVTKTFFFSAAMKRKIEQEVSDY